MINPLLLDYYPTVLYANANGSTGNIILNDKFSNYDYVEIYYFDDQNFGNSIKVRGSSPAFILSYQKPGVAGNIMYLNSTRYSVNNNTLVVGTNLILNITTSGITQNSSENLMKIVRVVGYKKA